MSCVLYCVESAGVQIVSALRVEAIYLDSLNNLAAVRALCRYLSSGIWHCLQRHQNSRLSVNLINGKTYISFLFKLKALTHVVVVVASTYHSL